MPILTVEIVGDAPEGMARQIADEAGSVFDVGPGRLWVRLRRLDPDDYAENGVEAPSPVFVSILAADPARADARREQAALIARVVAGASGRAVQNVHVIYEPSARARVAFGGELVPRAPSTVRTGVVWEDEVGYCRAVEDRGHVYVTGTAPVADDGSTYAPGQPYEQAERCLQIIDRTLRELEMGRETVVRTRMFVTDIDAWADYGRAHREFFGDHRPATTMVEVNRLISEDMLIEIEVDARA